MTFKLLMCKLQVRYVDPDEHFIIFLSRLTFLQNEIDGFIVG